MRVLVVTPWYPRGGDGAGSFVEDQVRAIATEHEPAIVHLTPAGARRAYIERDRAWPVVRAGTPIPVFPGSAPIRYAAAMTAAFRPLRRAGFRPDLLHAHVFTAGLAALPAARLLGVPLVISEHYSGLARGEVPRRGRAAAAVAYRMADLVCPVSASLQATLTPLVAATRTQVMPNPVDEQLFNLASPPPSSRPARILVVASLVPVKGVDVLIDAVANLAGRRWDLVVTVIGDGPQRGVYERAVRERGLSDLVQFVGRRSRDEVARAMQESHLLVAPSRWETFSVAVAEALCCGLPVVATRVGALPELVDDANGSLVEAEDATALAAAVEHMLDAHAAFDRRAISERARARFGARTVGERWDELYRELVGRRGGPRGGR